MEDERQLAVSFNIILSDETYTILSEIQQQLSRLIDERRSYQSTPHFAIATKFMPHSKSFEFTEKIKEEFSNDKKFDIKFEGFKPTKRKNYILLHPSLRSKTEILDLNRRALKVTKGIGFETPDNLPAKHPYDPHISVIKLKPEESEEAMKVIDKSKPPTQMHVEEFEITVETRINGGSATFPTIKRITLK